MIEYVAGVVSGLAIGVIITCSVVEIALRRFPRSHLPPSLKEIWYAADKLARK